MAMSSASLEVKAADAQNCALVASMCSFWQQAKFCDLILHSVDGSRFDAHRVVIASASQPFAALLDGRFSEGAGGPVQLKITAHAMKVMLSYIYRGTAAVPFEHAVEVLHMAHMYGLEDLEKQMTELLPQHWNPELALWAFAECDLLGLDGLELECERYIASHFEEAVQCGKFFSISAAQLGRLLKHPALIVRNEEQVVHAVFAWQKAAPGRDVHFALLLQLVRFPLMALSSLRALAKHAQTMGKCGVHLQREVKRAMRVHDSGGDDLDTPVAKRRCLPLWWSEHGSSIHGGVVVADRYMRGPMLPFDEYVSIGISSEGIYVGHPSAQCVLQRVHGGTDWQVVAGKGAPNTGVNDVGSTFRIAVDHEGRLLVADTENHRVLSFDNGVGHVVGDGAWQLIDPVQVFATANALYALDGDPVGSRIQKFQNGAASVIAGGHGNGSDAKQFGAVDLCVTDGGDVYVADYVNERVQLWAVGAVDGVTIAGGNGSGDAINQFRHPVGVVVGDDNVLYVADMGNHRVTKWQMGATSGVVVAGGHGAGPDLHQLSQPVHVRMARDGALYVIEAGNHRVTRWGAPQITLFD